LLRQKRRLLLSQVNLHTTASVQEQMQALPRTARLTSDELTRITQIVNRPPVDQSSAPTKFKQVELRLLKLKCVQKTKEIFEGDDEIVLTGAMSSNKGSGNQIGQNKIDPVSLGQFEEGQVKTFNPPIRFTSIPFGGSDQFPLGLAMTFTAIEKDADDISKVVQTIFDGVEAVKGPIEKAIDGLVGLSSDDSSSSTSSDATAMVAVMLLNAAISALIDLIGNKLVSLFKSDPFDPEMVMVAIPSATSLFPGGSAKSEDETVAFTSDHFKGKYDLTYDWYVS
jgi:hypothetical protein